MLLHYSVFFCWVPACHNFMALAIYTAALEGQPDALTLVLLDEQ